MRGGQSVRTPLDRLSGEQAADTPFSKGVRCPAVRVEDRRNKGFTQIGTVLWNWVHENAPREVLEAEGLVRPRAPQESTLELLSTSPDGGQQIGKVSGKVEGSPS